MNTKCYGNFLLFCDLCSKQVNEPKRSLGEFQYSRLSCPEKVFAKEMLIFDVQSTFSTKKEKKRKEK